MRTTRVKEPKPAKARRMIFRASHTKNKVVDTKWRAEDVIDDLQRGLRFATC